MITPLAEFVGSLSLTKVDVMEYVWVDPFEAADGVCSVGRSGRSLGVMFDLKSFPGIVLAAAIMCVLSGLVSGELTKLVFREC